MDQLQKIPYLDDDDQNQAVMGMPVPPMLAAPAPDMPAQIMQQPAVDAPPVLPRIGDDTPLGRFAQPILPAMPTPAMPAVETTGQADRDQRRTYDNQQLQKLNAPHMGQPGSSHPGVFGKILHGLATAGNIAGDVLVPGAMMNIPGTDLNNQVKRAGLNRDLANVNKEGLDEAADDSENGLRGAQTQHEQAETEALENPAVPEPSLAQAYAHAVQDAIKNGRDPSTDAVVQHIADAITSLNKDPAPVKLDYQTTMGPDGKPHTYALDGTGRKVADEGVHYEKPNVVNVGGAGSWQLQEGTDGKPVEFNAKTGETRAAPEGLQQRGTYQKNQAAGLKTYQPALDSGERFNIMSQNYEDAVKNHDQQAMLSLLSNHLGMTAGLQKGGRITKDMYTEAQSSRPWLQGAKTSFDGDGYLTGVTLTPQQMRQMVGLGRDRFQQDVSKAKNEAAYQGVQGDGPARTPGPATMRFYLNQAKGDVAAAKQAAAQDGWSVQ